MLDLFSAKNCLCGMFFLVQLAVTTLHAAENGLAEVIINPSHILRIGIAKDIPTPAWPDTEKALLQLGYELGRNLMVIPIKLGDTKDPLQQQAVLAALEGVDIFFATGNVLPKLFPLKGLKTPVCFIAIKESAAFPPETRHLFVGLIRGSYTAMLTMVRSLNSNSESNKMGFIYRPKSNIAQKTLKTVKQMAIANNLTLDVRAIESVDNIEQAMRQLKKSSDFVLLFPPAVSESDISELVKWQNKLKLPVYSQLRSRIKAGLVGGMIVDREKASPILASYIDKMARGTKPSDLPIAYRKPKYMVNLKAAELIGLKVSTRILRRAEIVN